MLSAFVFLTAVLVAFTLSPATAAPAAHQTGPASIGRSAATASGVGPAAVSDAERCATAWKDAGLDSTTAVTATAVGMAESTCTEDAELYNGPTDGCPSGSLDRGMWQINDCYHSEVSDTCAFDATCSAGAAYEISDSGTDWGDWVTYDNGAYEDYLPDAQAAVDAVYGGSPPPPPPPPGKYWVDTFANASVYASATSTTRTGTLYKGTNYVYCKAWGREVRSGSSYNHWWLKTDPDSGPGRQFVSAYYLSRWGNDQAKDNSGRVIPTCTGGKYWADTFANASVYATPLSTTRTGTLYKATNYVYCKAWGREVRSGSSYNHWWLLTDPDSGPGRQFVSAYYLSRWGNDQAKDNSGKVIPTC